MLALTILAIPFVPVFYVITQRWSERKAPGESRDCCLCRIKPLLTTHDLEAMWMRNGCALGLGKFLDDWVWVCEDYL